MGRLGLLLVALAGLALDGSGQDLDRIRQLHVGLRPRIDAVVE